GISPGYPADSETHTVEAADAVLQRDDTGADRKTRGPDAQESCDDQSPTRIGAGNRDHTSSVPRSAGAQGSAVFVTPQARRHQAGACVHPDEASCESSRRKSREKWNFS